MKENSKRIAASGRLLVVAFALTLTGGVLGPSAVGAGEPPPTVESLDVGSLGKSVSPGVLDRSRGGFMVNDASMSGVDTGNSVSFGPGSHVTFSNVLQGNAFRNASGIVNVVQNNGSNVLIQNMVQLNLQFRR